MLVNAADDGLWVDMEPLLQHRAVNAPEVNGVRKILAVGQLILSQRRVFGIKAAVDVLP